MMIEVSSAGLTIVGLFGLSLLGLFIGTVYFSVVARSCTLHDRNPKQAETSSFQPAGRLPDFRLSILTWQWFQVFVMIFLLIMLSMLFLLPAAWLSFFLFMVSPFLSRFILLLAAFSVIWLLIPLCFSPHGIFLCGQSLFTAMLSSTKVVRFSETGTGWFLLASIILYMGLGILWRSAPDTSWVALVGVFGHAFVATGLLAASFIHYRGGLEYIYSLRKITIPGRAS